MLFQPLVSETDIQHFAMSCQDFLFCFENEADILNGTSSSDKVHFQIDVYANKQNAQY
jgi:hypothetical protein